jgi:hypothetical protein
MAQTDGILNYSTDLMVTRSPRTRCVGMTSHAQDMKMRLEGTSVEAASPDVSYSIPIEVMLQELNSGGTKDGRIPSSTFEDEYLAHSFLQK